MSKQVPARNGGTLTRPEKGETMNPNGRPRKFISALKESGYKQNEINDCIRVMLSMTIVELRAVYENPKATVLEKTIAAAVRKGLEKGSLYAIESLLNRVYGKPAESVDLTTGGEKMITAIQVNINYPKKDE